MLSRNCLGFAAAPNNACLGTRELVSSVCGLVVLCRSGAADLRSARRGYRLCLCLYPGKAWPQAAALMQDCRVGMAVRQRARKRWL